MVEMVSVPCIALLLSTLTANCPGRRAPWLICHKSRTSTRAHEARKFVNHDIGYYNTVVGRLSPINEKLSTISRLQHARG
jgi:hypothetical protein